MNLTRDEIDSQPEVWRRSLASVARIRATVLAPGESVLILGCGTSEFVAASIATLREEAGLGVTDAEYASEPRVWRGWDRVVAITRSGTTSEVLDALRRLPAGVKRTVVTGVADSPAAEYADDLVVLDFADERSVVQTRFPTTLLFAVRVALGAEPEALIAEADAALAAPLPLDVSRYDHVVYLGTGWTRGLAEEAALKVRESAQAWAESYPLLDYRHGPLAVAHDGSLVWMFARDPELAAHIRTTGADVREAELDPLVELVQAQRLAVELAALRGLDPDQPRHLTRSIILT